MNELSEKSRQLAKVLAESCMVVRDAYGFCSLNRETAAQRIEQALLAERRLAMEEAAKIACEYVHQNLCAIPKKAVGQQCNAVAQALRAAAEKEVK